MALSPRVLSLPRSMDAWISPAASVLFLAFWLGGFPISESSAEPPPASAPKDELQIEVNKKGVGKEVVIHKGAKEWYLLVEVAEGNTVVIRQEKEGDTYLLDESEMHDRALSKAEIDGVIEDFINSVKARAKSTR